MRRKHLKIKKISVVDENLGRVVRAWRASARLKITSPRECVCACMFIRETAGYANESRTVTTETVNNIIVIVTIIGRVCNTITFARQARLLRR